MIKQSKFDIFSVNETQTRHKLRRQNVGTKKYTKKKLEKRT